MIGKNTKQGHIQNLAKKHGVSLAEAEVLYREQQRERASKGGKRGGRPFKDPELAKQAGRLGAMKRWGKKSDDK